MDETEVKKKLVAILWATAARVLKRESSKKKNVEVCSELRCEGSYGVPRRPDDGVVRMSRQTPEQRELCENRKRTAELSGVGLKMVAAVKLGQMNLKLQGGC